jgi:hypothetical protein
MYNWTNAAHNPEARTQMSRQKASKKGALIPERELQKKMGCKDPT